MEPVVASPADLTVTRLHDILRLRTDVFVVEQDCAYPEIDGRDLEPGTRHVWAEDDHGITCYLRVLDNGTSRQIGRVVTRPDARRHGLAEQLIRSTIAAAPDAAWTLEAQTHLVAWYERLGFAVDGEEYIEDGIPHRPMRLAGDTP